MSFFGVTFEKQIFSSLGDGAFQQFLVADGILRGLDMSYNGSTLTLGAGYLMAAGRLIGNDAALPVTVPASSGYARVVLAIDLTATATESAFDQIAIRVEQASSATDFPALTQGDINGGTDTTYEIALAIVQTSASGITGIVSRIEPAALHAQLSPGAVTADAIAGCVKMGTATPTTDTIAPGEIYLKYQ